MRKSAFTLIELLITVAIMGILFSISIFALTSARSSGRDGKRQADLQSIASALEIYRSDCGVYPSPSSGRVSNPLTGSEAACAGNNYMQEVPQDPQGGVYLYARPTATSYELCAHLEGGSGTETCGGSSNCGSGMTCNYKIVSP